MCEDDELYYGDVLLGCVERYDMKAYLCAVYARTLVLVITGFSGRAPPGIASGMLSRSPSPSAQTQGTQALLATPSPPQSPIVPNGLHHLHQAPGSPKLHSLPDNTLNPLGLLAEASLANRRAQAAAAKVDPLAGSAISQDGQQPKLGVASDVYFKPGLSKFCRWE